jgi:hypothetical protein
MAANSPAKGYDQARRIRPSLLGRTASLRQSLLG